MKRRSVLSFCIVLCFVLVMGLSLLCPSAPVWAKGYEDSSPDDYITKNFDVTAVFDTAHRAKIKEKISVEFVKSHHGIVRDIPLALDKSYSIENIDVPGYHFDTVEEDNFLRIRVGDADKDLTGSYDYEINYELVYFEDESSGNDYLAQNLLPTGWATSIRNSTLKLVMPKPVDWNQMEIYFGEYGSASQDWESHFTMKTVENSMILTGKNIPLHYGLTVRDIFLPEDYWSDAKTYYETHAIRYSLIFLIFVLSAVSVVLMWFAWGRDPHVVETVEFYPPDDMSPAEVGYALDGEIDDQEMMTLIFYLAKKGYLEINETAKDKYEFQKLANIQKGDEPDYIRNFFNGIFRKKDTVPVKRLPKSFRSELDDAKTSLEGYYEEKHGDVFTESSSLARYATLLILGINELLSGLLMGNDMVYGFIIPLAIQGWGMIKIYECFDNWENHKSRPKMFLNVLIYVIGFAFAAFMLSSEVSSSIYTAGLLSWIIIPFFGTFMQRRDEKSSAILGKLRGFQRFIRTAEYEKLVLLSEENPQYFYDILPYAVVFGMDTKWSKKFTDIKIPEPDWYHSYNSAPFVYSTAWCHSMIHSCTTSTIPSPPVSSSSGSGYSGGSSGGGFSGGGGGGGGGGAW